MFEILTQDFTEIYPEFTCFSDPVIENEIEFANCNINKCVYTEKTGKLAVMLMAAHSLYLRMENNSLGQGGIVTSDKVGDLSQSYSVLTPDHGDSYWAQTQYGLKYLQLRKTRSVSARVLD